MPLRIAFDMDGVLADMDGELADQARRLFGETAAGRADETEPSDVDNGAPPSDAPVSRRNRLTARQERRLWQHVEGIENFWESLRELEPGMTARLHALAVQRQWEVIFLTKRPATAGATAQRQTQRWLEAKGFALPSVYVVQGSRGRIAAALDLDFVVDDRPENCLDVAIDSKARPILVWRDAESQLRAAPRQLGIGVVSSVDRCLDILIAIDTPDTETSMLSRFLRLLGLKEVTQV